MKKSVFYISLLCILLSAMACPTTAQTKRFVLVLDPGHGGHDAGAVGKVAKEKDINLKVALEVGRLVERNCPDVKVVYTRSTDVFVTLQKRAEIANRAKADLFISIHTNALPKGKVAYGAETYTLGTARAGENLDVAKRENSVILYEEDYKTTYSGFDPNSAESYIIFELMQDQYMKQSVNLAGKIQKEYVGTAGRKNKGVHQAGFLVLRATSMPSVLTELGFISTPDEEAYLNSANGVAQMGMSIYRGFVNYKNEREGLKPITTPYNTNAHVEQPVKTEKPEKDIVTEQAAPEKTEQTATEVQATAAERTLRVEFRVQILTSDRDMKESHPAFKKLTPINRYTENGVYKYTYGSTPSFAEALKLQRSVADKFPGAFVVAFEDGKRISVDRARALTRNK